MPQERRANATTFWKTTCGLHIKNPQFNTPWNAFTAQKDILVVSIWLNEIVPFQDPLSGSVRRFVRLGDVRGEWNTRTKVKARAAADNVAAARGDRLRLVGFELQPLPPNPKEPDKQAIDFFYLDRAYELAWISDLSPDMERLKIDEEFTRRGWEVRTGLRGNYFELVPLRGPVPGALNGPDASPQPLEDNSVAAAERTEESLAAGARADQRRSDEESGTSSRTGGWGGGESVDHRALKAYVAANPQLFRLPAGTKGCEEFPLPSGDFVDVAFDTERAVIGIEVKSVVSDGVDGDYERGIYQVVKYRAVLEAKAAWAAPRAPRRVRVLLVLQGRLPDHLRKMAESFNCEVVEGIQPTTEFLASWRAAEATKVAKTMAADSLCQSVEEPAFLDSIPVDAPLPPILCVRTQ